MDYLKMLKSQLEGISSNWNGDESGISEERSLLANEAIERLEEFRILLIQLNINL